MKASPRQQTLLLNLQDLDTLLARLRRRREQLPERAQLVTIDGRAADAKSEFMAVQRERDTQKAEIDRLESDVATVQQRIERDDQLLAVSTSAKEAQAIEGELEVLRRRKSELEDRELELMETDEQAAKRFDAAAGRLSEIDQERAALAAELAAGEREIDREIAEATEERAGLSAEVQGDLREHYEQLRARHGIAVARLRGNVSEASNMELAPAELAAVREVPADELAYCPQSGAILVRVDE
ncbi:MAG: hypothetical protein GX814_06385 [Microbacteriaceae bacterium]|nr:hypothetical protein [Microbacteriaceae bacterium]